MAELFGKKTGICRGQGGSMQMFSKKYGLVSFFSMLLSTHPKIRHIGMHLFCHVLLLCL